MFPDGILSPPENVMVQARKDVAALGEKELREEILDVSRKTRDVLKESGSEINWSSVTSLKGTDEEKCETVQTWQAKGAAANERLTELLRKSVVTDRNEQRIEAIEALNNANGINKETADRMVKNLREQILGVTGHGTRRNIGLELANKVHEGYERPVHGDNGDFIKRHFMSQGNAAVLDDAGLPHVLNAAMSTDVGSGALEGGFQVIAPVSDRVIDLVRRQLEVVNLFPRIEVPYPQYIYMMERGSLVNVKDNNLPFTLESKAGISGTQLSYRWTREIVEVRELMVFAKVTGQQLSYVPTLQGRINNNMIYDALRRLDWQLLNGSGDTNAGGDGGGTIGTPEERSLTPGTPNEMKQLKGLLDYLGTDQTFALDGTAATATSQLGSTFAANDVIYASDIFGYMIEDIMEKGGATMEFCLMNPRNWTEISNLRDDNGVRLIGDEQTRAVPSLIGIPITQTPAIPKGTIVGGSRAWAEVPFMNGIDLAMTDVHSDDFLKNLITIRLMLRAALAVLRPMAFKEVTGFAAKSTLT